LKKLGQNFLINKKITEKFIETASFKPNDIVLEIGAGIGNLTARIAPEVKKVIAVEKDKRLIEILKENLKIFGNIEIFPGDILKFPISKIKNQNYKVIGNLPFYLTAAVIRKFLEAKNPPKEIILLVQKEVGKRICARPPEMNLLAVSVQFYAKPEIISFVSKKAFWPQPKIDSAIIKIVPFRRMRNISLLSFFKIVKAGFSQPRKQIINNLSKMLKLSKSQVASWLLENNIGPKQRAKTLSLDDWVSLTKNFQ
jgi:16S rRNA (adenine1518-N6/adenine1519-N6)-dimethyltransferase